MEGMTEIKRFCSWWSSSSYSLKLLLIIIIVPLIVLGSFMGLLGGKNSNLFTSAITPSPSSENSTSVLSSESGGNHMHGQEESDVISDEAVGLNACNSPPPLPGEVIEIQPTAEKNASLNTTMSRPNTDPSTKESRSILSRRTILKRKPSNLQNIEASLGQARTVIKEVTINGNQTQDPDFVPNGPMYWNPKAFHRSYLEMENQFKVFVYEEGEQPIFHNGPCKSIYAMEGNFISQMEVSRFRTKDPEKAHVFFLPLSVTSIVNFVHESKSHDWAPMKQTVKDYVQLVAHKYHYWNRSLGADHFMLACHDWGPELSSSVPDLFKNSIRALCNANTSEGFRPMKDVSLPEILLPGGTMKNLLGGPSPSRRTILAFFAGGVHGPIRPILLEHWENKDKDIQVHKYLPKGISYYEMIRKSRYCICPSGYEVASPRMVEALYMGCVPVLIKDHYVAPFSDIMNWKSFSVQVSVRDILNLKTILLGISQRQYIRMQRRGKQMRRHFEVNIPPKRFDVFHMILHSIWLRRLNVHVNELGEP